MPIDFINNRRRGNSDELLRLLGVSPLRQSVAWREPMRVPADVRLRSPIYDIQYINDFSMPTRRPGQMSAAELQRILMGD